MTKRRALVLTSEFARHPFRQSLPPHVFDISALEVEAAREADSIAEQQRVPPPASWEPNWRDARFFFQSFAAFFVLAYSFIL